MNAFFNSESVVFLQAVMPNYEYLMFGIIYILIPLVAVIDIFKSRFKWVLQKPVWLFVVITMPVVGVVLYAMAGRNSRSLHTSRTAAVG
ncbi:PLDc N-terminal domain-containing protein [Roseivirga sp. BDSF3-8]|uniref:PLDc N-terminal domain-containing protein n=1 Tax=Roseivirga sp. BDSF3-8 TaxID=3241598 RepID=UPI003531C278